MAEVAVVVVAAGRGDARRRRISPSNSGAIGDETMLRRTAC